MVLSQGTVAVVQRASGEVQGRRRRWSSAEIGSEKIERTERGGGGREKEIDDVDAMLNDDVAAMSPKIADKTSLGR